jgi:hypothetical protein
MNFGFMNQETLNDEAKDLQELIEQIQLEIDDRIDMLDAVEDPNFVV